MKRRILSFLLATILLISVVPAQAVVTEFSTDIADGSWTCVDEALRIVVTMPDEAGAESASYSKVSVYVNGSQTATASSSRSTTKPDDGVILHIPQNTLLPGANTIAFKATDAAGNQIGETQTITVNGFKPLNSTIISETDFNNVTDEYNASYEATLANDGWTYNDFTAQTETSYLSPEVLYGCDTVIWNDVSAGGHTVTRTNRSEDSDDLYLQCSTSSTGSGANLEFKLKEKEYNFPGEIIKVSMDVFSNESDTFRLTTSRVEDTVANPNCELIPFENMRSGWYRLIAYFDPYSKMGASYLYNNDGKLIGNDILDWVIEENGLKLTGKSGSFGFYLRVKSGKTAGFDNIKFERFAIGHYDDFQISLPEDKTSFNDATELTVVAYGEGAKVYVDGIQATAVSTDGATMVYNIDGATLDYGDKNIRIDYKKANEFETVYKNILLKNSAEMNGNYVNYLTHTVADGNKWPEIPYNILSADDVTNGVRIRLALQKKLADSPSLKVYENGKDVSDKYATSWKNGSYSYEVKRNDGSTPTFNENCYYVISVENHSIYFYTPGDSGAYLNLYDAELKDGNFSVMVEKAASASIENPVKFITAVYNDNQLVKVLINDLTIAEGVETCGVNMNFTGEATSAKAFVFDGLDSITPLATHIEAE